jgi:hypothetical protein
MPATTSPRWHTPYRRLLNLVLRPIAPPWWLGVVVAAAFIAGEHRLSGGPHTSAHRGVRSKCQGHSGPLTKTSGTDDGQSLKQWRDASCRRTRSTPGFSKSTLQQRNDMEPTNLFSHPDKPPVIVPREDAAEPADMPTFSDR